MPPAPVAAPAAPLNINKAPSGRPRPHPGRFLQDGRAHCEQSNLYKVKGELVAKNVVPKDGSDDIKDRITVSP